MKLLHFRVIEMKQAKTLTKTELKRTVHVTKTCSRYPERDVTMLLLTHLCGLRIGEVAHLRFEDVVDTDGTIRAEIRLDAEKTKNNHARTIFLPKQMQRQIYCLFKNCSQTQNARFFVMYAKEPAVQCKHCHTAPATLVRTCWDCWCDNHAVADALG